MGGGRVAGAWRERLAKLVQELTIHLISLLGLSILTWATLLSLEQLNTAVAYPQCDSDRTQTIGDPQSRNPRLVI